MTGFLWERVTGLTTSWHDGGGLLVFAQDLLSARSLMTDKNIPAECEAFTKDPDLTFKSDVGELQLFEFPDAGCC